MTLCFGCEQNADDDVVTRSRLDALLEAKAAKRTEMSYTDPSAGVQLDFVSRLAYASETYLSLRLLCIVQAVWAP
jgi:hypothetical protein